MATTNTQFANTNTAAVKEKKVRQPRQQVAIDQKVLKVLKTATINGKINVEQLTELRNSIDKLVQFLAV